MEGSVQSVLRQSLGQSLVGAEGLVFARADAPGSRMENLDQLRLTIGTYAFRFLCSGEGEALLIDGEPIHASDLGEYGTLRRMNLILEPLFQQLSNTTLESASLLASCDSQYTVGVLLDFAAGTLVICNWGDELKVWDNYPHTLFEQEGIASVPLDV